MTKILLLILTSLILIVVFIKEMLYQTAKFSTTQKLGKREERMYNNYNKSLDYLYKQVPKKDYPPNNSIETKEEIDLLLKLKNTRPENMKEIILYELELDNMIKMFTDDKNEQIELYQFINNKLNPIIMKVKVYYDRVRPSYLESTIEPVVNNPAHPAYPSGHATQAYFMAYMLSNKYPENKKKYFKTAINITLNRERGGFHYRSDSNYGKNIAKIIASNFTGEKNFLINKL